MRRTEYRSRRRDERREAPGPSSWTIAGLVLIGSSIVLLIGAGLAKSGQPKAKAVFVPIIVDVSGSHGEAQRRLGFGGLDAAVDEVLPRRPELQMYQFDRTAWSAYDGVPDSSKDVWPAQDAMIKFRSKEAGTYISSALTAILPAVRRASANGQPIAIICIIDGEDADPRRTKAIVELLASVPNVRAVWLIGPEAGGGLRSQAKALFAAFGDRLIVSGKNDMASGLAKFRDKLRGSEEGRAKP